jgi:hypothetical protein
VSVALKKDQSLCTDDPVTAVWAAGTSHTFETRIIQEPFCAASSAAVTVDLKSQLVAEMIERRRLPASPLPVRLFEMEEWGRIMRILEKLDALDAVFGMFKELTSEQKEAFEEEVKRRPLFQ